MPHIVPGSASSNKQFPNSSTLHVNTSSQLVSIQIFRMSRLGTWDVKSFCHLRPDFPDFCMPKLKYVRLSYADELRKKQSRLGKACFVCMLSSHVSIAYRNILRFLSITNSSSPFEYCIFGNFPKSSARTAAEEGSGCCSDSFFSRSLHYMHLYKHQVSCQSSWLCTCRSLGNKT